ncbi:hypothetical protein [Scytonema sp. NUACC21]
MTKNQGRPNYSFSSLKLPIFVGWAVPTACCRWAVPTLQPLPMTNDEGRSKLVNVICADLLIADSAFTDECKPLKS